jgi:hypothetical protein
VYVELDRVAVSEAKDAVDMESVAVEFDNVASSPARVAVEFERAWVLAPMEMFREAWLLTIVVVAEATLEKLVAVVPWNVVSVEAVLLSAE